MKAWEHHNKIIQERKAREELAAMRAGDGAALSQMGEKSPAFALLLNSIAQECKQLSALPQGAARIPRKAELVKEYLPVVEAYIAKGDVYCNMALTQVMVWLFDVGDIDNAMRLARVAIEQGQPLPERFNRDIKTAVADLVLEWAIVRNENKRTVEPYFSEIFGQIFAADPAAAWQIHDKIKVKYAKLASLLAEAAGDVRRALAMCELAESIDADGAQVKTRKATLVKAVAALDEAAKNAAQNSGQNSGQNNE